jgi:uncharacterized protein (DUF433 family)
MSDDASDFKTATNEWLWPPTPENNTDKNVNYRINIPPGTASGKYIINGTLNKIITVTGDNTIEVTGGSSGAYPTITATPVKSVNVTASQTETVTAQPTVTIGKQTSVAPIETAKDITPTNTKSPGFGVIISIGIIAAIYIMRRMK